MRNVELLKTLSDVKNVLEEKFDGDDARNSLMRLENELINIRTLVEFLFDGLSEANPNFELVSETESRKADGQALFSWSHEDLCIEPVDSELTFKFANNSLIVTEKQTGDVLFTVL